MATTGSDYWADHVDGYWPEEPAEPDHVISLRVPRGTVPFVPARCPRCRGAKCKVYGAAGRLRYHTCRTCGEKFRSFELSP